MTDQSPIRSGQYEISVEDLTGRVTAYRNGQVLASSTRAKVMYETRLPAAIYFPRDDVVAELSGPTDRQTFCPFKGTAFYYDLTCGGETLRNAIWTYAEALPESAGIEGYVGFAPGVATDFDLGDNRLHAPSDTNLTGPVVDWLLRDAAWVASPEDLVAAFSRKLRETGIPVTRLSVMIWSLHPMIAARYYRWTRDGDTVDVHAPPYEIHDSPAYLNSPLRHVSNGLGGVRQKLNVEYAENSFPIMEDLRAQGATDYVAMPMVFSDGRINVLTLTTDDPDGFGTSHLGMVFELSGVLSRYLEVFTLRDNAQTILDTYVGKRTGARVLGGEIRRGDGDEIDAAIMFCDLCGSTALEEQLGRQDYLALLNHFFDTVSARVVANGGEVLKFIGDAVLAVFPAGEDADRARCNALTAAQDIVAHLGAPADSDVPHDCSCAIGLAFGGVTYGNVGSRERLDFTVIGQPANIAARLGDHGKQAGVRIVATADIAAHSPGAEPLGELSLHNVSRPVAGFSIPAGPIGPGPVPSDHAPDPLVSVPPA
ncbi:MAG: DUF427 domain-containing protein [Marinibacterium sp.]